MVDSQSGSSWRRPAWALALICLAAFLLSTLRVDTSQLQSMALVQQVREVLSKLPAQKHERRLRLDVVAAAPWEQRVRSLVSKTAGVVVDPKASAQLRLQVKVSEVEISLEGAWRDGAAPVPIEGRVRLPRWTSLLPPVVAILLAITLRSLLLALGLAIALGALLHMEWALGAALSHLAGAYIGASLTDPFKLLIFAFTFGLVGMLGVVTAMGGTHALVELLARRAQTARSTRLATALMGLAIFFDDYANTVVVGTTMRPLTDRMRISREKLAYLVDSTAAPIAGLALISTWIGFEVGQFQSVARYLGLQESGYSLFLSALPFRFYCLFTLVFVFASTGLRRDFGPMLAAERRARVTGAVMRPGAKPLSSATVQEIVPAEGAPLRWYNAAVPVGLVLLFVFGGMVWVGASSPSFGEQAFELFSLSSWRRAFSAVGDSDYDGPLVMALSALAGSVVAVAMAMGQRILGLLEALKQWVAGARMMIIANAVLLLAWAIQAVCSDVGTSLYLTAALQGVISPTLLPLLVFMMAAVVALATGTSWGTMGILVPTVGPMAYAIGDPVLLVLCLGAVLDGAIFGDHCSPLSDTTVLSSIASSCDHVDHVRTQLPYAVTCMVMAMAGYGLAAHGVSAWGCYAVGAGGLLAVLFLLGRDPDVGGTTADPG